MKRPNSSRLGAASKAWLEKRPFVCSFLVSGFALLMLPPHMLAVSAVDVWNETVYYMPSILMGDMRALGWLVGYTVGRCAAPLALLLVLTAVLAPFFRRHTPKGRR